MPTDRDHPQREPKGGCYHLWIAAEGGNAFFRWRRCFTASNADAKKRQWLTHGYGGGDRPSNLTGKPEQIVRLRCRPDCRCGCYRYAGDS